MVVQLLAVAKIVYGLGAWLTGGAGAASPNLFSDWVYVLQLAVFCTAAAILLAGRGDERTRALGTLMLLFATLFVDPLLRRTFAVTAAASTWALLIYHFEPIAFAPTYFWNFTRKFPDPLAEQQHRIPPRVAFLISITIAGVLIAANLIIPFAPVGSAWAAWSTPLGARTANGHFWEILVALSAPAFFVMFTNLRASPEI